MQTQLNTFDEAIEHMHKFSCLSNCELLVNETGTFIGPYTVHTHVTLLGMLTRSILDGKGRIVAYYRHKWTGMPWMFEN